MMSDVTEEEELEAKLAPIANGDLHSATAEPLTAVGLGVASKYNRRGRKWKYSDGVVSLRRTIKIRVR